MTQIFLSNLYEVHRQVVGFKVCIELPAESGEPRNHTFTCWAAGDYEAVSRYFTSIKWGWISLSFYNYWIYYYTA